jgi:S-DNA-T family DNA segregation ATPase FtsK/SpoIIIE
MHKVVTGEQVAQLYNRDPFALPIWRAPVYQTPAIFIIAVQLYRLVSWLARLIARHPLAAGILTLSALTWVDLGWIALIALAAAVLAILVIWRCF